MNRVLEGLDRCEPHVILEASQEFTTATEELKKNIAAFLMDPDIMGFDVEDLEDIYPELFEDVKEEEEVEETKVDPKAEELSDKQKKYQAFFQKALKKFGVKSPSELDKEKRKEFFNYVDKNYDAGENETD